MTSENEKKNESKKEKKDVEPVERFEDKEAIKDKFPTLYSELNQDPQWKTKILMDEEVETADTQSTATSPSSPKAEQDQTKISVVQTEDIPDPLRDFNPEAIDFIRRATTKEEALEIISYLSKREEISDLEATKLRKQLEEEGLRSFGDHKKPGYYFKMVEKKKDEYRLQQIKSMHAKSRKDKKENENSINQDNDSNEK